MTGSAYAWLRSLRSGFVGFDTPWDELRGFEGDLVDLIAAHDLTPAIPTTQRSPKLLAIRSDLARLGHVTAVVPAIDGGRPHPPTLRPLMQFICGYYDLDLRDSVGLGHGRLISSYGSAQTRDRWVPRLLDGAIAGIALTEPHGGSQIRSTRTHAIRARSGTWKVRGTKTWISRLTEAEVFIVFFADPDGTISAAAVPADSRGLERRTLTPSGLAGWHWGELHFHDVEVGPGDIIGDPGQGLELVTEHFAAFRALVAATAIGATAKVLDTVSKDLASRRDNGLIRRVHDGAAITIGRSHAAINAAALLTLAAHQMAVEAANDAPMWSAATKAFVIDTAHDVASQLTLLIGASGFTNDSALAKARRDLGGLLYADGIHDSLYRSTGHSLTNIPPQTGTENTHPEEASDVYP